MVVVVSDNAMLEPARMKLVASVVKAEVIVTASEANRLCEQQFHAALPILDSYGLQELATTKSAATPRTKRIQRIVTAAIKARV